MERTVLLKYLKIWHLDTNLKIIVRLSKYLCKTLQLMTILQKSFNNQFDRFM